MLSKALVSPDSDRGTRMSVASLLDSMSTSLTNNRAPGDETMRQDVKSALPELLLSLQTDQDDGVRGNVLACFESLLPVMNEKEKAPFFPSFCAAWTAKISMCGTTTWWPFSFIRIRRKRWIRRWSRGCGIRISGFA